MFWLLVIIVILLASIALGNIRPGFLLFVVSGFLVIGYLATHM